MSNYTALLIAATVLALAAAAWLFWWVWLKPKRVERVLRRQGLSGNPYRLLYGDLKDLSSWRTQALSSPISFTNDILPRAIPQLHHTLLRHGKNSFLWMGPIPMVYITQPDLIRDVFTRMDDFGKPELNRAASLLAPGLARYDGEKWAKHRKMLNPAFHIQKLKLMLPAFHTSCVEMISKWEEMTTDTGPVELDVWPYLVNLTADVISRAAFGSSFEQGRRIFELLTEQIDLVIQMFQSVNIPGLSEYMPTKLNRRMKKVNEEIQALLMGVIEKRKKAVEAGEETDREDLLGMLLMENTLQNQKKHCVGMTMREMIDECKLFYFAGQETTSVLLVWTIVMLGNHQDWQKQAREEVLEAFGKTKPDFDGLSQLKKVSMILYEVLRLYTPVGSVSRMTKRDVKLGKLHVPAGVIVNAAIMAVHQDPEVWGEDALEFRPERFAQGTVRATGGNIAFFPFGWGPRICIGQNFSLLEAKMALAVILQRFCFQLSPSYTHAPLSRVTLQPQHGAHILLQRL